MAYVYLLDLYKDIDQQVQNLNKQLNHDNLAPEKKAFLNGKASILKDFRSFLSENLDSKLPKRIRKRLSQSEK